MHNNKTLIICLIIFCCYCITTLAGTRYSTIYNRFAGICQLDGITTIEQDYLTCDNKHFDNILLTDSTAITAHHYRIQMRASNEHNSPRHAYTTTDANGQKRRIDNTTWGIAFCINNNKTDYWAATIKCINTDINNDINDRRIAIVTLAHMHDGIEETIATSELVKGVNLYDGFNSIEVEISNNEVIVSVGDDELKQVITAPFNYTQHSPVQAGCLVGGGSKLKIERIVVSIPDDGTINHDTGWTLESLKERFGQSIDPMEGFWHYLDRDMEDRWLRLGGRYKLATVATDTGYDIIYIDGASTRSELWHSGMLKGRMTRTIFNNHYDLMWVDATLQPITQDAYASIENGILLTLKFPVYKSQLRLSKILNP